VLIRVPFTFTGAGAAGTLPGSCRGARSQDAELYYQRAQCLALTRLPFTFTGAGAAGPLPRSCRGARSQDAAAPGRRAGGRRSRGARDSARGSTIARRSAARRCCLLASRARGATTPSHDIAITNRVWCMAYTKVNPSSVTCEGGCRLRGARGIHVG